MISIKRLLYFLQRDKFFAAAVLAGIIALGVVSWALLRNDGLTWNTQLKHVSALHRARALDGRLVPADQASLRPYAVMVDNHVNGRPVAGLEYASVVYESVVEGEVTRFLALFDPSVAAQKIGPIRSARPFFVELAKEWDPVYFHAGGSPQALADIATGTISNVNEISADGIYFWRDSARGAPHNLFSSIELMHRAVNAKGFATSSAFLPWQFSRSNERLSTTSTPVVESIFNGDTAYHIDFVYDPVSRHYLRWQDNQLHKTEAGIILTAINVIKQFVDVSVIDAEGRLSVNLDRGGRAEVYQQGSLTNGTWRRVEGRTRFFDETGSEIFLQPGRTWVLLVFNSRN